MSCICDQKFKKDSISEDGIFQFSDYKNLLNKKLDIIIICLTNNISPQVVIESLKKDLHVFCEKPPGRNLNDILNVIEQEKKNKKLKLMYGFNHRFHDSVKEALKITRKKKLGNIKKLRIIKCK